MNNIIYLPATDCIFYREGFCLYEEILNPGYFVEFRCKVLKKWEREYEDLLDRAEIFHLDLKVVERIWDKGNRDRLKDMYNCPTFKAGEDGLCFYLHGDICLLTLPICKGKCHLFTRGEK
ncbi:MAG: hypothetical protein Q9M37_07950 [Desulfonauticus sp.]|nr:hypothetical protein [Desulfonauticus sp.]